MTQPTPPVDPFAGGESVPSLSFKDAIIGAAYTGVVTEAPSLIQARDYETGQPASWPDGNPKMTVVTKLKMPEGDERSLWAPKPSSMFSAIAAAQQQVNALITVGGTLTVTLIGEKANATNPRLNAQKLYKVDYKVPDAFATAPVDPWATPPATPAPAFAPSTAVPQAGPTPEQIAAYLASQAAPAAPAAKVWTPEQVAAAQAAGISLPGM